MTDPPRPASDADILAITRPHPNLMTNYGLQALATLIAFPIVLPILWIKYRTLRYRIDEEGVSAKWGLLFRREVYLTYRRIQDIHVKRSIFERWLGIGTVDVQTAAGSTSAELSLEGMSDHDAVRDFLYRRMRGMGPPSPVAPGAAAGGSATTAESPDEAVALLREIRASLDETRRAIERSRP